MGAVLGTGPGVQPQPSRAHPPQRMTMSVTQGGRKSAADRAQPVVERQRAPRLSVTKWGTQSRRPAAARLGQPGRVSAANHSSCSVQRNGSSGLPEPVVKRKQNERRGRPAPPDRGQRPAARGSSRPYRPSADAAGPDSAQHCRRPPVTPPGVAGGATGSRSYTKHEMPGSQARNAK